MQRTALPADERTAVAACLGLQSVTRLRARGAQGLEGFPDNRRVIVLLEDHRHAQVLYGGFRHTPSYLDDFRSALADIRARTSAELVAATARSGRARDSVLLSYRYDARSEPKLRLGKLLESQRVREAAPAVLTLKQLSDWRNMNRPRCRMHARCLSLPSSCSGGLPHAPAAPAAGWSTAPTPSGQRTRRQHGAALPPCMVVQPCSPACCCSARPAPCRWT